MKKKSIIAFLAFLLVIVPVVGAASITGVPSVKDNSEVLADAFNEIVDNNEWNIYSAITNGEDYVITYDNMTMLDDDLTLSGTLTIKPVTNGKNATIDIVYNGTITAVEDGYWYRNVPAYISASMAAKMDRKGNWDEGKVTVRDAKLGDYQINLSKVAKELEL